MGKTATFCHEPVPQFPCAAVWLPGPKVGDDDDGHTGHTRCRSACRIPRALDRHCCMVALLRRDWAVPSVTRAHETPAPGQREQRGCLRVSGNNPSLLRCAPHGRRGMRCPKRAGCCTARSVSEHPILGPTSTTITTAAAAWQAGTHVPLFLAQRLSSPLWLMQLVHAPSLPGAPCTVQLITPSSKLADRRHDHSSKNFWKHCTNINTSRPFFGQSSSCFITPSG